MRRGNTPLFLPRPEYRRHRFVDAARLLPIFGVFLVLLPILWTLNQNRSGGTARNGIYLLVVWSVLVVAAAWLAPRLASSTADDDGSDQTVRNLEGGDGDAQSDRPVDGA